MVLTLLGTAIGGLTSIIPGVINYFERKDKLNHEREMLALRTKHAQAASQIEIDTINAKADANEGDSLRRHDASLSEPGFIGALRRSVRPIITYLFFFLFAFVKVVAVWSTLDALQSDEVLNASLIWTDIVPIIWDDQTSAIFAAVIGFWFGSRTIEKMMRLEG